MSVSARPAKDALEPANVAAMDLRATPEVLAGSFFWEGPDLVTGWHRHPYHQIEYALAGVAEVETSTTRYLLPPQQAIWIPAGLAHITTLRQVRSVSVFVDPQKMTAPDDRARVLAAAPLLREMMSYSTRWPISRPDVDAAADTFFDAFTLVALDWLAHETPLCLPTASDPVIADVTAYTNEHLRSVTVSAVCRAVGISERTLRRRFPEELGMTWRDYRQQCRLLRAMSLIAEREISITDAAIAVGFESPSAFSRAFQARAGESPSEYKRRVRGDVR